MPVYRDAAQRDTRVSGCTLTAWSLKAVGYRRGGLRTLSIRAYDALGIHPRLVLHT